MLLATTPCLPKVAIIVKDLVLLILECSTTRQMKLLRNSLLLSTIFCFFLFTSCQKSKPATANNIVVQVLSEPESLHPTNGRLGARNMIMYFTAQTLNRLDPQSKEQAPLLAALPEVSADGLTYTYTLDPKAQWNDGSPIRAADVAFSIKASASPLISVQSGRGIFEKIKDFQPDPQNDRRFSLIMRDKYVGNYYIVNDIFIIDKRFFDPQGLLDGISVAEVTSPDTEVESNQNMIAWANEFNDPKYNNDPHFLKGTSGPYIVQEWISGQQIVLTRNDAYWGKGKKANAHQQHPDKIIFKAVLDENAVELQVKQQKIDVATAIPSQAYKRLSENETAQEHYHIDFRSRDAYTYIAYNTRPDGIKHQPVFSDRNLRWAFSYVLPVDDIIRDFYNGQATRITSPISVASKEYNTSLKPVPFNPDSAKARLDRAGWTDSDGDQVRDKKISGQQVPLKFQLSYPANQQTITDIVQRIVAEARKVGMDVEPNPVDFGLLGRMLAQHDFDAIMIGSSSSPLPHDFKQMWSSGNWQTGENFTGFGTAYTDSLIEALRSDLDPVHRKQAIDHMQELLFNEQPVAFFFNSSNRMAIHKRFSHAEMYEILPFVLMNTLEVE